MRDGKTGLFLAAGGVFLALGVVLEILTLETPLYRYDFKGFLSLTRFELGFLMAYLVLGGLASLALTRGLMGAVPHLARLAPASAATSRRPRLLIAFAAAFLVALIGFGILRDRPVTDDERTYLFQARLLLSGHLAVPAPPLPEFLTNVFVVVKDGRWFGQYPPGHPFMLAPAVALGIPRLAPILLAGATVLLFMATIRRWVSESWALLGGAILAVSPLFILTGATLLSHSTSAFSLALAVWGALRVVEGGRVGAGLAAGLGLGLLLLTRPWTAVTLGAFPAFLLLRGVWRGYRRAPAMAFGLGALAVACFLLANRAVSGSAFTTGYGAVRAPGQIELGFGPVIPGVYTHTLILGLKNALLLAFRFHFWAWGWPLGFLPLLWAWRADPTADSAPHALSLRGAVFGSTAMLAVGFLSYVPYWSIGVSDTGPVKTYELLLPATALAVFGLAGREEIASSLAPRAFVVASAMVGMVLFWPIQSLHLSHLGKRVAAPYEAVEARVRPPALVFVGTLQPDPPWTWVYGRPNPRPDLQDPVLYVRDLGARNPSYRDLYRDRPAYRLEFRDGAYRVDPLP